ncbi:hypothetical protein QCA50_015450 [Cerrena zonata]|uniref:Major facilitator superfamily (MFS) profile domain-containing protein n=1 Tax=Cerrena zonata TaxID=2478898 RepID=A0AAW0FP70_9APHY
MSDAAPTTIPRILVGNNENAASSSIELSKGLAVESALEVDSDNTLPPPPSSERIRRRSELRQKPVFTGEEFELPVLPTLPEGPQTPPLQGRASGTVFAADPSTGWSTAQDVELASGLPSTTASSVRLEEDTSSTAPVLSPAEKANHRSKGRQHFAALCYCILLEGWNDGSTGPLLPTIQRYYNLGFALVSLLFVFNCIGFVSGAMMNVYLNDRFGFGKVVVFGQ